MYLTVFNKRIPLFYVLQIIGWSGYALDRYLSSDGRFFPVSFIYLAIACALTFVLRPIYKSVWARRPSLLTVGLVAVTGSLLAGALWLFTGDFVFWLLGIRGYPNKPLLTYIGNTIQYTLVHHKPFLFLSWSALYFGFKYWQDRQAQEERALKAGALAQEAELKMLRYQLNPHFLFNALNSIQALIRENPPAAERMLSELSEFLRYSLINHKDSEVSLKEEVAAIRNYLDIEKIRFEEKLHVDFQVDPATENFRVPCFLIHPLVENAVKHGMQTSALPLNVKLSATTHNGTIRIEVLNTGEWKPQSAYQTNRLAAPKGAGVGLENVRQRLAQAFPNRHRFEVTGRDGWVSALIELQRK